MDRREVSIQCTAPSFSAHREALVALALDLLAELGEGGGVGVRIVGRRSMTLLNRKYRGKAGATDVLSFPSGERDESGLVYLGDIAICGPVAAEAAAEAGISVDAELRRLLLHGILHLLGYDHETDGGRMVRKERALRRKMGLGKGE